MDVIKARLMVVWEMKGESWFLFQKHDGRDDRGHPGLYCAL